MSEAIEGEVIDPVDTTTAVAEYSPTAAALALLVERYAGKQYDVTTKDGLEAAKKGRAELRGYRTGLEKKRVEIKQPALDRCRLIDSEAKRITEALSALEDPIDAQIKAEEDRREAERARLEQERIEREAAQAARMDAMRNRPLALMGAKAEAIGEALAELEAETLEGFDESVLASALTCRDDAIRHLRGMHATAKQTEEAAAIIAAQREQLERQQREAEEAAAAERAERDQREAAERAEREAAEAKANAARDAELAQLRAEQANRDRIEQERQQAEAERGKVIAMLRGYPDRHANSGPETLRKAVAELAGYALHPELFARDSERHAAEDARAAAATRLQDLLTAAIKREDDQRAAEQAEREAAERATAEAQQREAARKAADELWIAEAPLDEAIVRALALLAELGHGARLETRALAAAFARVYHPVTEA